MAEMNDEQLKQFLENFQKLNPAAEKFINLQGKMNKLFERGEKGLAKQLEEIDKYTKSMKLLSGDTLGKFTKSIKEGFGNITDFKDALDELDEQIKNTEDSFEKQELAASREAMARRASTVAMQAAAIDFSKAIGKNVISGITATTGKFITGLQNNASATELSSTLMSGAVDMAAGSASAAGQGIAKMGDTAMALAKPGSKLQILGAAASLAGSALSGMAEGAGKLAKFGIEVLSKEVEKTVTAYNNMSAAGAMFADGMTGMRNAANSAGLTVDQFSKVVVANADALAGTGLGVGEASKKMGAVSDEMSKTVGSSGKSLRRELLQLGVSFEEQAALSAEVMADMRRGRSSQLGDNKAIAQQTAEYAGSLKTIAAITGEDAKSKMAEQRRNATQVAFRLKLQELEQKQPGITQKMLASMATMDETSRTALMQQMTIGAVVDKSANVMMAGSEAYSQKINGMAELAESGQFTTERAQQIQAEANDKMQGDLKNFREIGIAGMTGSLTDLNNAISGQIANMDKVTVAAVESSQKLVEAQKASTDKLTEQTMAAAEAAQNLKVQLEQVLTPAIAKFSEVSAAMLGAVQKQLAELGLSSGGGGSSGPSFWDKLKSAGAGAIGGATTGAMAGGAIGGTVGTAIVPLAGTAIGGLGMGAAGGIIGGIAGAISGWFDAKEGKARGGIAEGPTSGYLEKLHGDEAVIPLSDGRTVPVSLDISGIGKTLAEMVSGIAGGSLKTAAAGGAAGGSGSIFTSDSVTNDSTGMMQEQIALLNEIKEILSNSNSLQQQYVYNTYQ